MGVAAEEVVEAEEDLEEAEEAIEVNNETCLLVLFV